jgi:hypothetical protein
VQFCLCPPNDKDAIFNAVLVQMGSFVSCGMNVFSAFPVEDINKLLQFIIEGGSLAVGEIGMENLPGGVGGWNACKEIQC